MSSQIVVSRKSMMCEHSTAMMKVISTQTVMSSQLHDLLKWQKTMANSTTQHTSNQIFLHNCSDLIQISTKNAQGLNMQVLASVRTTCLQTPSVAAASASGSCHRLAGSGSRHLHHAGSNNLHTLLTL